MFKIPTLGFLSSHAYSSPHVNIPKLILTGAPNTWQRSILCWYKIQKHDNHRISSKDALFVELHELITTANIEDENNKMQTACPTLNNTHHSRLKITTIVSPRGMKRCCLQELRIKMYRKLLYFEAAVKHLRSQKHPQLPRHHRPTANNSDWLLISTTSHHFAQVTQPSYFTIFKID